jgi:hypothetical protein
MPEITNKELAKNLTDYFKQQDIEVVAHVLAHTMIDISRLLYEEQLPEKERLILVARMQLNYASLCDFAKNGPRGKLKVYKFNSDEL